MSIIGLHPADIFVLLVYLGVIIWLGKKTAEKNENTSDFFLAGRSLGKFYQFFLNFGVGTNSDQAVAVTRETYRQGVGGMWIQFIVLFLTPFFWFTTLMYRRARLTTIGDFFAERFNSKALGAGYACFILFWAFVGGGVGYMVAAKTMMAMTPKSEAALTVYEKQVIAEYRELQELGALTISERTDVQNTRFNVLKQKELRGELKSFYSHTDPIVFYVIYGIIVGVYTMLGGFRAAAITDAIQGMLIIFFSMILIPLGLSKIGGLDGLHATVPEFKFELFGSAALSDYAWFTIAAMAIANLASIIAFPTMMQTAGSATNERSARFGQLGGMFLKRFLMLAWIMTGLIAIGLYSGQIHDPDLVWGYMSRDLLWPGFLGLMLVGILAANMSSLDAISVSNAALFIRNLYQPLFPYKSENHYLFLSRLIIAICLIGGIFTAVYVDNLLELFKYFISIPAIFGAPIWLGFLWRRLTKTAVAVEVIVCFALFAVIPNLFLSLDWAKYNPQFLVQTNGYFHDYNQPATLEDVELGRAEVVGETIMKEVWIEPKGIFFERVVRVDPEDPDSPLMGMGRFEAEIWVLSLLGIDFTDFRKSELVAIRFIFNALFPFLLLFLVSWITKPVSPKLLDYLSAKLYTEVNQDLEKDAKLVEEAADNPDTIRHKKLFPNSNWEIAKMKKEDYWGFGGSCVLVLIVLLVLWAMVTIH